MDGFIVLVDDLVRNTFNHTGSLGGIVVEVVLRSLDDSRDGRSVDHTPRVAFLML